MPITLNAIQQNCIPDLKEFSFYRYIKADEYCEKLMTIMRYHRDYFPCLSGTAEQLKDTLIAMAEYARDHRNSLWPYDEQIESFREAVNKRRPETVAIEDVQGTYGTVTKEAFETAITHTVGTLDKETILESLGRYISGTENKGIKRLETNAHRYTAEVKITVMGDYRFYTKTATAPYTFDIVRRHI